MQIGQQPPGFFMTASVCNSSPDSDDACDSNSKSSAFTPTERGATKLMLVPHEKRHDLDRERTGKHLSSMPFCPKIL